jgi:hypothetical protein
VQVGELFINLGVKGQEKTIAALTGIRGGLNDTTSNALAAKAAIVGLLYAVGKLISDTGQVGTSLTNANATLGMSTRLLQQYQYAARQAGASNEEMTGSFKSLSQIATDVLLKGNAPEGLARIAQVTKMQTGEMLRLLKSASEGDVIPLFKILDQYARLETNIGYRNKNLKGMGISEGIAAGSIRNKFTPEILEKAPLYGDKEVKSLDNAHIGWKNLANTMEMAFGHFNAKHGAEIVGELNKIIPKVIDLAEAFDKLATNLGVFEKFGKIIEGWTYILQGLLYIVNEMNKSGEGAPGEKNKPGDTRPGTPKSRNAAKDKILSEGISSFLGQMFYDAPAPPEKSPSGQRAGTPQEMLGRSSGGTVEQFMAGGAVYLAGGGEAGVAKGFRNKPSPDDDTTWSTEEINAAIAKGKQWQVVDKTQYGFPSSYLSPSNKLYHLGKGDGNFHLVKQSDDDYDTITQSMLKYYNKIHGLATGGMVYLAGGGNPFKPRGTDTIPAMLTPGEYVLNTKMVGQIGSGPLEHWRRGGKPPAHFAAGGMTDFASAISPTHPAGIGGGGSQNINVNQNLNFQHEGKDAQKTGESVKQAIQQAYRQMPGLVQGA